MDKFTTTESRYDYQGQDFDRWIHAWIGQFTGRISPVSYGLAFADWLSNLALAPAKQLDILNNAASKLARFTEYNLNMTQQKSEPCIQCRAQDKRFINELWTQYPFNLYSQAFLLMEQLWDESSKNIKGISKHHEFMVNFLGRQFLDIISPSNFPWLNPEILQVTYQQKGMNFVNGLYNYLNDIYRNQQNLPPVGAEQFQVGENVAITKGKVIYRNRLIELIQYEATTPKVLAEPILIIPAWIMKYYILDLSQHNSLVKYLVDHGHTVFMISWKNPDSDDRDLGLEDYIDLGIMEALNAINNIIPHQKIHTVGYCIGGTLLMIAAAAMAGKFDDRLKTITLFAAQIDFRDAGELLLFVDPNQINFLEDIMWKKGYLDGAQMAGAFSMLRSNDLIWSHVIHNYLLGQPETMNDLMAWDSDTTRLPYKMHSEYLHKLFLNNDLVQGRFKVEKKRVSLPDIKVPIFAVSTLTDHIAPWKSVYKIHLFTDADVTFVLTSGGHNAGIVSEPGHPNRTFQMLTLLEDNKHINPEIWQERAPHFEGSWWPKWQEWLTNHSGNKTSSPTIGINKDYKILCDAPGTYVLEK